MPPLASGPAPPFRQRTDRETDRFEDRGSREIMHRDVLTAWIFLSSKTRCCSDRRLDRAVPQLKCKYQRGNLKGSGQSFSHFAWPPRRNPCRSLACFRELSGWTANFCAWTERRRRTSREDGRGRGRKARRGGRARVPRVVLVAGDARASGRMVPRSRERRREESYSNSSELIGIVCRRHREPLALAQSLTLAMCPCVLQPAPRQTHTDVSRSYD